MNNIHSHVRSRIHGGLLNHSRNVEKQLNERDDLQAIEEWDKIDEKVYYNLQLRNLAEPPNINFPLSKEVYFNINRNDSILPLNLEQYEVAVEYFSIDTSFIPIFYIKEEEENIYQIRLTDVANNISYETIIDFYANGIDVDNNTRSVYSYERIVIDINQALQELVNNFVGLEAPFIQLEGGVFKFYSSAEFNIDRRDPLVTVDALYTIDFSKPLARLFNCFYYKEITGNDNTFSGFELQLNYSQGDELVTWNAIDYLVTEQLFDPRPAMLGANRIVIITDIPVKDELLGEKDDNTQKQLLDYIINDRVLDKTRINFYPQIRRWINLTNSSELRRITIRVLLEGTDGTLYPYKISQNENFFMKLIFRRKQK